MQYEYCFLVFLSTVSVAVLFEVKKIYVIERDFKTGQLRARRQNVPVQSHTVARIGGLQDYHQQQQQQQQQQGLFNVAVSPPPLLQSAPATAPLGGQPQQQQPLDLATTVDLTSDGRASPIDYLTPPPNADFQFHNFQPTGIVGGGTESVPTIRAAESHQLQFQHSVPAVQAPPPPPLVPLTVPASTAHTSTTFTPGGGGSGFPSVQVSSPSNQVHSLSIANAPLQEQFTPYTPTLQQTHHESGNVHHQQPQSGGSGGRWELGFDASDILTPPFASASEQSSGSGVSPFFQQDFPGQETAATAGSVRNNKQYPGGGGGGGAFFGGGGGGGGGGSNNGNFDTAVATGNKFTPLDAVVRTSPSNNNGVYWGTPKTAQQQPIRPPISFAEPNPYRYNQNNNNNHHHLQQHHSQYLDAFQMPFTGQFDGPPLSQGTVAEHVVHSSFRIKRQLHDGNDEVSPLARKSDEDDDDEGSSGRSAQFGDRKPVYSFVKTDRNGNFKWSVRHGY
ncbi:Hypothetical protein CINCED_3A018760 [Cinara cedri]|uniref:Uncharacterized protein n=1 Tax=Cinara cedri TaxID=506608 RepID=A0A5E4MSY7_9HEMI|nr:Hypothetical protein CINCED_3A018760 [Cinara cedri]